LVIGESLMDVVRTREQERRYPGGSPMNVAFGLGRLGLETRLLTRIGRDSDGEVVRQHLRNADVEIVPSSFTTEPTSTAVADIQIDGEAAYTFDLDWRLPPIGGLKLARWIHVGSIATFLAPGADSLEQLLSAVDKATTISYDPNIRPSIIGEHSQAVARFERIARIATVVKMSDFDAEWLYPGMSDDFVIDKVLELGPKVVALTRGAAGARLATHNVSISVPAPEIIVADTIGAGDSFMSTLINGLLITGSHQLTAKRLERIAQMSATAGAITCTRVGAQPPAVEELNAALRVSRPRQRA
jgi:fructokinase